MNPANLSIKREDLVQIVKDASVGLADSTILKYLHVAETTDAFAAGWFHCDGVGCIAQQAKHPNQVFHKRFDTLMAQFLDLGEPYPMVRVEVAAE